MKLTLFWGVQSITWGGKNRVFGDENGKDDEIAFDTPKTRRLHTSNSRQKGPNMTKTADVTQVKAWFVNLDGQTIANASVQRTRSTLTSHSAVPRGTQFARMNANRGIGIAAQRTQVL